MNTLIAYAGKHGGTGECAERMAGALPGKVTLLALSPSTEADVSPFDTVILGTAIYLGKPRKEMQAFCRRYQAQLQEKRLGLFLCCIQDQDEAVAQTMALAYPKPLLQHAAVLGALGGTVNFPRLKGLDRFIMKMVAGDLYKKSAGNVVSTVTDEKIGDFIKPLLTE